MKRQAGIEKNSNSDDWKNSPESSEKSNVTIFQPPPLSVLPPAYGTNDNDISHFSTENYPEATEDIEIIPQSLWYRTEFETSPPHPLGNHNPINHYYNNKSEAAKNSPPFYPVYPALENSPIEAVRATVSINDDRTLECLTFRFWVLSFLFTVFGAAFTQYYYFTDTPYQYSVFVVQLASYPLGKLMARFLSRRKIRLGSWFEFSMNPGPFNMKEHALIGVAAASATLPPYAISLLAVQRLYFAQQFSHIGSLLLLISSQCLGYGLAGIAYPILVEMPAMVWPPNLVTVAFYNSLHEHKHNFIRTLSRMQFFWIVFGAIFLWELVPQFFAPILVSFTVLCYFGHKNPDLVRLGSGEKGLGMLTLTFDWTEVTWTTPLSSPWWAQSNLYLGTAIFLWIIMPIVYYSNFWSAKAFSITSTKIQDNQGHPYNTSRIININGSTINNDGYDGYSPIRLSPYLALAYGCGFIAITSTITHVCLWHGKDILEKLKSTILEILTRDDRIAFDPTTLSDYDSAPFPTFEQDPRKLERDACIHVNMMRAYPKVPIKWYTGLFFVSLIMACAFTVLEPVELPMWGVFASLGMAIIGIIPVGVIQAMTNQQIGLNIISEVIAGYIFPGQQLANLTFKVYSYWGMAQCLTLLQQFKFGQYMKIPPRKMFIVQIYGTLLALTVNYLVMNWMMNSHLEDILQDKNGFSSMIPKIVQTASIIWGAAGPQHIFSPDSLYFPLVWCWFIGFLLPIPFWFIYKRWPNSRFPWRFVNIPLLSYGANITLQFRKDYLLIAFVIGFCTQFVLYRYRHDWWRKYNYVGNAALESGAQICALVVFIFTNGFFTNVQFPEWYGNNPLNHEQCG
ncbi:11912_t:CDS:2 [Ambispora leptoticha]|uniref:11912_t:CDS:1 n=1 Tax=Ambispora leptoticha TaxID=144679 RepID=A0A9N9BIW5_9GLOM|nr:11912_t:CDS:2 [Ambispora leptoticha]